MLDLGSAGQETTDWSRERLTPLFGRQVLLHRYALVHPPQEVVHRDLRLEQALLDPGWKSTPCPCVRNHDDPSHSPVKANLSPRSAPRSPCPRNGTITPGESCTYTSGSSYIFTTPASLRVMPGMELVLKCFPGRQMWGFNDTFHNAPRFVPTRRRALSKLDLPTFGMPTTRTRKGSFGFKFGFSLAASGHQRIILKSERNVLTHSRQS